MFRGVLVLLSLVGASAGGELPLPSLSVDSWVSWIAAKQGVNNNVLHPVVSPDGGWLATPTGDGIVRLWSVETGRLVRKWKAHRRYVWKIAFSSDGTRLVSFNGAAGRGERRKLRMWDTATGKRVWSKGVSDGGRSLVAFSDDGTSVVYVSGHEFLRIDAQSGDHLKSEKLSLPQVQLRPLPDGRHILAPGTKDGTTLLWSVDTRKAREVLAFPGPAREYSLRAVALSRRKKLLAAALEKYLHVGGDAARDAEWRGHRPAEIALLDVNGGKELWRAKMPPLHKITTMAFSPDGHYLVTAGHRPNIDESRLAADDNVSEKRVAFGLSARLLPNGLPVWVVVRWYKRSYSNLLRVWEVKTGRLVAEVPHREFDVAWVGFTPDSAKLVFGGSTDGLDQTGPPATARANRATGGWQGGVVGCISLADLLRLSRN